jgi:DNA-binding LacI/PurR family transcriptional regulator
MRADQIKSELLTRARCGTFNPNERLPSLRKLASEYSATFAAVRKAMEMLKEEGVLVTYRGDGTYLADNVAPATRVRGKTMGLAHLSGLDGVGEIANEWLDKGWLIIPYNATRDHQDQRLERKFLERAFEDGFAGVALHPSPLDGGNLALCRELRGKGMKIAFLSEPFDGESFPSAFLLDYERAGYQAVVQMLLRGFKRIVFCHRKVDNHGVWKKRAGLLDAVEEYGVELLDDIVMPDWRADEYDSEEHRLNILADRNGSVADAASRLPSKTAFIVDQNDVAEVLRRLLDEKGVNVPGEYAICHCENSILHSDCYQVSGMSFSRIDQINAALKWIADEKTKPSDSHIELFRPCFTELGTTPEPIL